MPIQALPVVPVTGTGIVVNEGFEVLQERDDILHAAAVDLEQRQLLLERGVKPVGGYSLGEIPDGDVIVYAGIPAAGYTTATRVASVQLTGFADLDGKVATCQLPGTTRIATAVFDVQVPASVPANVRITVYEIAANGAITSIATGLAPVALGQGIAFEGYCQIEAVSATTMRIRTAQAAGGTNANNMQRTLHTAILDGATLTVTSDVNDLRVFMVAGSVTGNFAQMQANQSGMHRRKGYPIGTYGIYFPSTVGSFGWIGLGTGRIGGIVVERAINSTFNEMVEAPSGTFSTNSWSLDRLNSGLFAVLCDGQQIGQAGYAARLSLVQMGDGARGTVKSLRIPNAVAGNVRLGALSATLMLGGWTTGATYGSYLFERDPANNDLALRGALTITGIFGTVPADIFAYSATKACLLTKGTGVNFVLTTVSCDPTVAAGVSPFAQVAQTPPFALGRQVTGAADADVTTLAALEHSKAVLGRKLIVARNATRAGALELSVVDFS